jgi:ABC-type Na+ efflux pump permease subunit
MKYVFLIARREFIENAKTKGFWIGIATFPAMLFLMIQAPIWLDKKATPVRYFVLVDQSGLFEPTIKAGLEKSHHYHVLEALGEYARDNTTLTTNSPEIRKAMKSFAPVAKSSPDLIEQFLTKEGVKLVIKSATNGRNSSQPS